MNDGDAAVVKQQLGADDIFALEAAARCVHGKPAVLLLSPVASDGETPRFTAIATPLWLSCPYLNKKIHALESAGTIAAIQAELSANKNFASEMKRAGDEYAVYRKKLFNKYFTGSTISVQITERLASGIGGTTSSGIKCLHAHAAHYIALGDNLIGRQVMELLHGDVCCAAGDC